MKRTVTYCSQGLVPHGLTVAPAVSGVNRIGRVPRVCLSQRSSKQRTVARIRTSRSNRRVRVVLVLARFLLDEREERAHRWLCLLHRLTRFALGQGSRLRQARGWLR